MSKKSFRLLLAFVLAGDALLIFLYYYNTPRPRPQARLVDIALGPDVPLEEQEKATLEIPKTGPGADVALRQILKESPKPEINTKAIMGLVEVEDWESVPTFLELLENFSVDAKVRNQAGAAAIILMKKKGRALAEEPFYVGDNLYFEIGDTMERQQAAIDALKAFYKWVLTLPPKDGKK
jgi:hypothetical protein